MRKNWLLMLLFVGFLSYGQQKKDSVKTEVINVITSYTPKLSDVFKIKKKPTIQLSDKVKKKPLSYSIFSAPVASTFIPKSGTVKGIDVGKKERLYNNYAAVGYGNNNTPFAELFLYQNTRFDFDFGMYAQYLATDGNIETTPLQSNFSEFIAGLYITKQERYFDWTVGIHSDRKEYNWYGLPNLPFSTSFLNGITPNQNYNLFALNGKMVFEDSKILDVNAQFTIFKDNFESSENSFYFAPSFNFSLDRISRNLEDLELKSSIEYVGGSFAQSYQDLNPLKHSFLTLRANPIYRLDWKKFNFKIGSKLALSLDNQRSITDVFIYPDVKVTHPVIKEYANIYLGATGGLTTNSYQSLTSENPFLSPTLSLTQTHEKYHFYGGLNGKINTAVSYNFSASYKDEEDKVLFVRNNSKSSGTLNIVNGVPLKSYEYGNSFSAFYDDVTTISFFGELAIDVSKKLSVGINGQFDNFTMTNQQQPWNLPELQGTFFAKYKSDKFFFDADVFYVGERKDILYSSTFPSTIGSIQNLEAYVDANINTGYHFNDKLSVFIKLNNFLNTSYERFANFNVQGFQALGGVTYKFDF